MSRLLAKFSAVLLVSLLILVATPATPALAATELIINGGFETGSFSGWTAQQIFYNDDRTGIWCAPWQIVTTTPCVFEPVTPVQGTYMAYNSFDGDPMQLSMYQDVSIPAASTALFSFNYRVQWYNYNRGWTQARTMDVQVRDTSSHILETIHHFSTGNAVCCFIHEDTHWITASADLSAYAGQTIRLFIIEEVPQQFSGGAEIYFDNFSLQSFAGSVGEVKIAQSGGTTTVNEGGTIDTFTATLSHSPSSPVTINLTTDGQCTASPNPVVLNSGNWNTGISVTVEAVNDSTIEGNHLCGVTTADAQSSDATFDTINPVDVPVMIFDNDGTAGTVTSCPPPTATMNQFYSYTFTAAGNPAPTLVAGSGSWPAGLTFNSSTGVLSGTPTEVTNGGILLTMAAENIAGEYEIQAFRMASRASSPQYPNFGTPLAGSDHFSDFKPMPGMVNKYFCYRFQNTGFPAPTYNLTGTLPAGLEWNDDTISGTPTEAGTSGTLTVTATNSEGVENQNFVLTIYPAQSVPAITSSSPPVATVGVPYSHTFTVTGGPTPKIGLNGAALPPGLTFANNVISGTPTAVGSSGVISAVARNGTGRSAAQDFTITVNAAPEITSNAPPTATVGTAYTHTFTATGYPAPTFSLSGASLPAGLEWNGTNTISGTPLGTGGVSGTITVTASNDISPDDTQDFTITVNAAPEITSNAPPAAKVGTSYTHTFTATGYPAPTFSLSGANLPAGLEWNGTNTISGTPLGTGGVSGTITVTASNGIDPDDTQNFTITVNAAPEITSNAPPAGTINVPYSHTFTSTGYPAPTFSLSAGTLPAGLDFLNGVISGMPMEITISATITVTASNGISPDDTQDFTITINGAAPVITSQLPPAGKVGDFYSHTFTTTGSPTPTFALSGASLPDGLSFSNGVISGTPTANAIGTTGAITITASNGILPNATQNFTITINGIPPQITSAPPPNGSVGTSYAFTITASGTPAPTFTISGALPAGLIFNNGVISGTPQLGGTTATITVTASNGFAPDATQSFTITIASLLNAVPSLNYYTTATPTLRWNPITGVSVVYEVEVYNNANLTGTPIYEYSGAATETMVTPALVDGTYYWRVRANTPTKTGAWSKPERITVNG